MLESHFDANIAIPVKLADAASLVESRLNSSAASAFSNESAAAGLISEWIEHGVDWSRLKVVAANEIPGLDGAYDASNDLIIISDALLSDTVSVNHLSDILAHELGHRIDARIDGGDTTGDEGAAFAAALRGEIIAPPAESDRSDGLETAVSVSDSGGFEGSNQTLTLEGVNGSIITYSYEHYFIPDRFIIRYEGLDLLDTGFTGGSRTGTIELPAGQSDQLTILMVTDDAGTGWNYNVSVESGECADTGNYVLTGVTNPFEPKADDPDICETTGTVTVARKDGVGTILRVADTSFAEHTDTLLTTRGATVFAPIGSIGESLFTGNFDLDLASGISDLSGTNRGDFELAGLAVDFDALAVQSRVLGLDARIELPTALGALQINTKAFGDKIVRIGPNGVKDFELVSAFTRGTEIEVADIFDLKVKDMSINYIADDDVMRFQGVGILEDGVFDILGGDQPQIEVNFLDGDFGDEGYIQLSADGSVDVVGTLSIATELNIFRGFSLNGLEMSLDTTQRQISGSATIGTPFGMRFGEGVEARAQLDFLYSPFEFDGFQLSLDNLNKPIPGFSYFFFQSVGGGLANLAPSDNNDSSAILTAGATLGPQIQGENLGRFDGKFEVAPASQASLAGDLTILKKEFELELPWLPDIEVDFTLIEGKIEAVLDWSKGTFSLDSGLDIANGIFSTQSSMNVDSNFNFGLSGTTSLTMPTWLPDFLGGGATISGDYAINFTNNNVYSDDYIAVWGDFNGPLGNTFTKGLRIGFDGKMSLIGVDNIPTTSSWFIEAGREYVLLNAIWENDSANTAVRVIHPDGTVFEEADFAANGIAIVDDFSGLNSRVVLIDDPVEGTWDLEVVDTTGLGTVSYYADGAIDQSEMALTTLVPQLNGDVTINWNATDTTPNTTVTLYYDDDLTELDGLQIGSATLLEGSQQFTWETDGVVPGSYFVYAMVDDGQGPIYHAVSSTSVTAGSAVDVSTEIEVQEATATPGGTLTYTITVRNLDSGATARGVTALFSLPDAATLASSDIASTATNLADLAFDLGDLAADEVRQFDVMVNVPAGAQPADAMIADVYVISDTYDPEGENDGATSLVIVDIPQPESSGANLKVDSKFGNIGTPSLGETITYTIDVTNDGSADAVGVRLFEDTTGLSNIGFDVGSGIVGQIPGTTLGTIAAGTTVTVTVTAQVALGGVLRNTTSVESDSTDGIFTDNEQVTTLVAQGNPPELIDLSLDISEEPQDANGDSVVIVTINNEGPGSASDVQVRLTLPSGATIASQFAAQGTYDPTSGVWVLGNMRDGLTRTLEVHISGAGNRTIEAEVVNVSEMDADSTPNDGQGDDFSSLLLAPGSGLSNGTDGDDNIVGDAASNVIDAMAGNDTIAPLDGADTITLGEGSDVLTGNFNGLYGDTVTDFGEADHLRFENTLLNRDQVFVTPGSAILNIDEDDDGAIDGAVTLEGDFTDGDFMAVTDGTDTTITFETFLPTLANKTAVDTEAVNGVNNQSFLTGDGSHDFRVTLDASARSGYHNSVGVYEVDASGNISSVRILIADTHDDPGATVDIVDVAAGNQLGFFIIQNGARFANRLTSTDTLGFINGSGGATPANVADGADLTLSVNGTASSVTLFHSIDMALNSDGVEHALSGVDAGGESLTMGFEDLTGGGDKDYQDVVFSVERFVEAETVDNSSATSAVSITTGAGDDTVSGGPAGDTITTGDGDDIVDAGSGNDTISIGDGDDVVDAGEGDDVITAGQAGGNDFIDGGIGDDTVEYPSLIANAPVRIDLQAADRSDHADVPAILAALPTPLAPTTAVGIAEIGGLTPNTDVLLSIENATGGAGDDLISGSDLDNVLDGGSAGADSLSGQAGDDILRGGDGDDTLEGGSDQDTLSGGTGDDSIDGGNGYDTLVLQGDRDDYTWVTNTNGSYTVTDTVANRDGIDTVRSVEQVAFADTTVGVWSVAGHFDFVGTDASETIVGTDARDRIEGRGGDDLLQGLSQEDQFVGGPGDDTIDGGSGTDDDANYVWDILDYYNDASQGMDDGLSVSGVSVDLAAGTATDPFGDTDTIIDIERVYGTNLGDLLNGSDGGDPFDPFGGNDTVNGGEGYDHIMYHLAQSHGGRNRADGDTLGISVEFSTTVEGTGTVIDDSYGNTDLFTGIEVVRATELNDLLIGGAGHQQFRGYAGDDTIDGGDGFDILTYRDDANYDGNGTVNIDLTVVDGDGFTTVIDPFGDTDLIKNFEYIEGTGGDDTIVGNAENNEFRGRAGDDLLSGGLGNDTLEGQLGNDVLTGGDGDDDIQGDAGQDTLTGGAGNDFLVGGADTDQFVFGLGDGNDIIEDFTVGSEILILNDGLTITDIAEADLGGEAGLDSVVTLSSGQKIELWDVAGITDTNDLLNV